MQWKNITQESRVLNGIRNINWVEVDWEIKFSITTWLSHCAKEEIIGWEKVAWKKSEEHQLLPFFIIGEFHSCIQWILFKCTLPLHFCPFSMLTLFLSNFTCSINFFFSKEVYLELSACAWVFDPLLEHG